MQKPLHSAEVSESGPTVTLQVQIPFQLMHLIARLEDSRLQTEFVCGAFE